ncbi:hypothetical protein Hanom_Chr14g01331421 [Helianthus anomalus]
MMGEEGKVFLLVIGFTLLTLIEIPPTLFINRSIMLVHQSVWLPSFALLSHKIHGIDMNEQCCLIPNWKINLEILFKFI